MTWVDALVLLVLACSALLAFMRGFVREALGVCAWVGAFYVAIMTPMGGIAEPALRKLISNPEVVYWVSRGVIFLIGLIINALAPRFAGTSDRRQALKTAAYAFTPAWLSAVFGLLPGVAPLLQFVAGLYGIYLLYLGLPTMMRGDTNALAPVAKATWKGRLKARVRVALLGWLFPQIDA